MGWFLAKLVYEVYFCQPGRKAHFDEQLRLIIASNWRDALERAWEIGISEEKASEQLYTITPAMEI